MNQKQYQLICFTDEGEWSQWAEICSVNPQQNLQISKENFKLHHEIRRKRKIYESRKYSKADYYLNRVIGLRKRKW